MRDFLNAILAFIGAASLTDAEFTAVNALKVTTGVYDLGCYTELSKVLVSRESVSTLTDRLKWFFMSKGVQVPAVSLAKSNIYIGSGL